MPFRTKSVRRSRRLNVCAAAGEGARPANVKAIASADARASVLRRSLIGSPTSVSDCGRGYGRGPRRSSEKGEASVPRELAILLQVAQRLRGLAEADAEVRGVVVSITAAR